MNKIARISLFLITLFLATAAIGRAQAEQSVDLIKKQIDELKSRGANNSSWPPAVKSAYEASLDALYATYNKAIDVEIRQLIGLLEVVTNQSARRPLEDQINQLKMAKQQAPAQNNTPQAVNTADAGAGAGNGSDAGAGSRSLCNGAAGTTSSPCFTLVVHARVKGTGYPVKFAHVKLLRQKSKSTPSEYEDASDFICGNPSNQDERCNTNSNGVLILKIPVSDDTFKIAIQKNPYHPFVQSDVITPRGDETKVFNAELVPRDDEYYRSILGLEQTGVSAGRSAQSVFLNLFVSRPILSGPYYTERGKRHCRGEEHDDDYKCAPPRHRIWGDFRLTSVPQQEQNLFQAFNGSFGNAVNGGIGQMRDLAVGFSFLAGYQYKLFRGPIAGNRFDFSLVVGGGASTALAPEKTLPIFKIPDSSDPERRRLLESKLRDLRDDRGIPFDPSRLEGYADITFVTKERDRFLRSYYGGFRFETHYGDTLTSRPSGMFDLLFGQDEAVTGGRLQGSVLRLDGFFPLPIGNGNMVYLFGTSQLGLKRSKTNDPLLLPLADNTQTAITPTTLAIPVPAADRDLYRIGIGVNLFQVFSGGNKN